MSIFTQQISQGLTTLAQLAPVQQCDPAGGSFFGFPTWYKYLAGVQAVNTSTGATECNVAINNINSFWLIGAAVLELLLRIGALASLAMIVYGGVLFIMSHGQPDKTKQALNTVIYACIGLVITISATVVVTFIAGRFN